MMTKNPIPVFPKDSRVCFLGDSITSGSAWVEQIFEYYLKKFPKNNIRIYDCGVGGGTAEYGYDNIDEDLFSYNPTHVVMMYTGNDMGAFEGTDDERVNQGVEKLRILADAIISKGITLYIGVSLAANIKVKDEEERKTQLLQIRAMREIIKEYNLPYFEICDLFDEMTMKYDIFSEDDMHPNRIGDTMIAKYFLYCQGFEEFNPEREDFATDLPYSKDGDMRAIYNDKIRRIWLARRNISTIGDTMDAKIERLKGRIETRADGAWDDFCYFRAVDFIELAPHMEFYRKMFDSFTEKMVNDALNS